jgi:N-methylhydantoinase B
MGDFTSDLPAYLSLSNHLLSSIAEEMGVVLWRSAFSPNIKERRDFSCALFDPQGQMVAQAAHIPVHLGSMPLSVQAVVEALVLEPGDMAILNDPYRGGTHLPDITLVSPVYGPAERPSRLLGYVASRAHHADVGGMSPGSMPLAQELYQEGLIIPPLKLYARGELNREVWHLLLANVRTPRERQADLRAQAAANRRGAARLLELAARYGEDQVGAMMEALLDYAERLTRRLLRQIPAGEYAFADRMDDDGVDPEPAWIRVSLRVSEGQVEVDFAGTSPQRKGGINAVYAITLSAVLYVIRSLLGVDAPTNGGCLRPITLLAPEGSLVNARPPAAVAAGNVETSQRIVDVLLGALAQALPERIPAASQGTMNNLAIGGWDPWRERPYTYYETLGGGAGAGPDGEGADGIHTHMTNTLNTPVEALEFAYPLRVERYQLRPGSGGAGRHRGGRGIRRDLRLLHEAQVSILSDRRKFAPYGLAGGKPGRRGRNLLLRGGKARQLPSKITFQARPGDLISIRTPGGGGYGALGKAPRRKRS